MGHIGPYQYAPFTVPGPLAAEVYGVEKAVVLQQSQGFQPAQVAYRFFRDNIEGQQTCVGSDNQFLLQHALESQLRNTKGLILIRSGSIQIRICRFRYAPGNMPASAIGKLDRDRLGICSIQKGTVV